MKTKKIEKKEESTAAPSGNTTVIINRIASDPMQVSLVTPVYVVLFWKPLLGPMAYGLWETLRALSHVPPHYRTQDNFRPTVDQIAALFGYNRQLLLGRAASAGKAARVGELDKLVEENVCTYRILGEGSQRQYIFDVVEHLPLLTFEQVRKLDPVAEEMHTDYLARFHRSPIVDSFFKRYG